LALVGLLGATEGPHVASLGHAIASIVLSLEETSRIVSELNKRIEPKIVPNLPFFELKRINNLKVFQKFYQFLYIPPLWIKSTQARKRQKISLLRWQLQLVTIGRQ
jgi:hypothetical protein